MALSMKQALFGNDDIDTIRTRKALQKSMKRKDYELKKALEIAEIRAAKKAAKKMALHASSMASKAAQAAILSVEQSETVSPSKK